MPSRKLPNSDAQRQMALYKAKRKNDNLPVGTVVISQATADRLDAFQPDFDAKVSLRDVALNNQTTASNDVNTKRENLRTYVSQFFKTFNNGVAIGTFPAQDRNFYGLDVSSSAVPDISNEDKLEHWSNKILDGDPLRVAGGGAAMAMPTIVQFTAVFNAYEAAKISQSNYKDAYDDAQEVVAALRPTADILILNIWDEVEAHFNTGDIESKRRRALEWGVVYINMPNEFSMTGTVTDTDNNPVDAVEIAIPALGVSAYSNSYGEYNMPVVAAGTYEVTVTKEGYQPQTLPGIEITEGVVKILNIQIVSTTATLIANVYGEGLPLNGATVTIDELSLSANTNETGQAIINGITPGTYNVTASATGYQSSTQPATFIANNTENLSFDLIPV